jgi:hypothetical protein
MNQEHSTISFTPYFFDATEFMSEVNDEPQPNQQEGEDFLEEEFDLYLSSHFNFENEKTTKNEIISYEPTNPFINQITFKLPCPTLFVSEEEEEREHNEKKRKFEQAERKQKKRKYETNHCFAGNFESFDHFFQGLEVDSLDFNQIF